MDNSGDLAFLKEQFFREEVDDQCSDKKMRGKVLHEALDIINGERQDVYGATEDSFRLIADYWNVYLDSRPGCCTFLGRTTYHAAPLESSHVAMMMTLFKIAREANQHKLDNIRDCAGYLGIYADMMEEV